MCRMSHMSNDFIDVYGVKGPINDTQYLISAVTLTSFHNDSSKRTSNYSSARRRLENNERFCRQEESTESLGAEELPLVLSLIQHDVPQY